MWKWVAIALGTFAVLAVLRGRRNAALELRKLESFLRTKGIDFVRVRRNFGNYGWPSYTVVFDSDESSAAFRSSAAFDAFIQEVQMMHKSLAGFESDRAVGIEPIVRSSHA